MLLTLILVGWLCTNATVLAICRAASRADERDER
jgi:hypothetical protein